MDMFDRLMTAEPPIVRQKGGDIVKCMEDHPGGYQAGANSPKCQQGFHQTALLPCSRGGGTNRHQRNYFNAVNAGSGWFVLIGSR
jgi:hypothetical protein